jgi:ABC-type lipoprotein release transport system permease subunit
MIGEPLQSLSNAGNSAVACLSCRHVFESFHSGHSRLTCGAAGLLGLLIGFVLYEAAIFGATKLVSKLQFEWVVDWAALGLSVVSIFVVGILSGLTPALKAEKLQVIESLRSE